MANIRIIIAVSKEEVLDAIAKLKRRFPEVKIHGEVAEYRDVTIDVRNVPDISIHQEAPLHVAVVTWGGD